MNDDTYTPCTNCGRPIKYCKGQCCNKPKKCGCSEYGPAVCGTIRGCRPECPYTAVIPSVVIENTDGMRNICDSFIHVSDINTTFYVDDQHRTLTVWAGPVEYNNYDLASNSLNLRSQFLIDFDNNRGAYYDKTGSYKVFNFGGGTQDSAIRLRVNYGDTVDWVENSPEGKMAIDYHGGAHSNIVTFEIPLVTFQDEETYDTLYPDEVFDLLESGKRVILDNVPLGAYYPYNDDEILSLSTVDNIELSARVSDIYPDAGSDPFISYSGGAYVMGIEASVYAFYGVAIRKLIESAGGNCVFSVQGRGHHTNL